MKKRPIQDRLAEYTRRLVDTYSDDLPHAHNLDQSRRLPSQERTVALIEKIFDVVYPGFFGNQHLTHDNVAYHIGALLDDIADELDEQIYLAIRSECPADDPCNHCVEFTDRIVDAFVAELPEVRRLLSLDVQAAYRRRPRGEELRRDRPRLPGPRGDHGLPDRPHPERPRRPADPPDHDASGRTARPVSTSTRAPGSVRASSSTTAPGS